MVVRWRTDRLCSLFEGKSQVLQLAPESIPVPAQQQDQVALGIITMVAKAYEQEEVGKEGLVEHRDGIMATRGLKPQHKASGSEELMADQAMPKASKQGGVLKRPAQATKAPPKKAPRVHESSEGDSEADFGPPGMDLVEEIALLES